MRSRCLALAALCVAPLAAARAASDAPAPVALAIHGGAGTLVRSEMTPELEASYLAALKEALRLGFGVLSEGGSSLDAVETTLRLLEDSPLFNAGKGAVFSAEGRNELDASIMDGATRRAGAVAGVTTLRHPISAARAVMEQTEHVLLAGEGAERFAHAAGLERAEPDFFWTERRWRALERARERERKREDGAAAAPGAGPPQPPTVERPSRPSRPPSDEPWGTVGAVALDREGRLAAGTSTGGMTNKKHGRVGDSPIIGAGTWADDACAVSSTGHGEFFIRYAVAHDICARARYGGLGVARAAEVVIHEVLVEAGGEGGVITLDAAGRAALVFNSAGMYRGWIGNDGTPHVAIFEDE